MGIVERFGPKVIAGWVSGDPKKEVVISVNDREVARTAVGRLVNFEGEPREIGFARSVADLWQFLRDGDAVTISHDGSMLPIVGQGFRYVHQGHGALAFKDLVERLEKGYIFDRRGKLALPLSRRPQLRSFFRIFGKLSAVFRRKFNYELFPMYGTLLGCIRDNNFIAHDDDIDFAYVSKFRAPEEVKREYLRMCSFLIDRGYIGVASRTGFSIRHPIPVTIYPAWINAAGIFEPSFGYHGKPFTYFKGCLDPVNHQLGRYHVKVPAAADQILAQIYGDNWRISDPGFDHASSKRRFDDRYWPTEEELKPLFWKQFYKSNQIATGSTFAEFIAGRLPSKAFIVDFGCGTGRDTNYLAEVGYDAVGVDASAEGIARANETKTKKHLRTCSFIVADAASAKDVERVFDTPKIVQALKAGRDVVIYLRFFIHAIPLETQNNLLGVISRKLPSFTLAAEFRTERDQDLPKFNAAHYRRFVNGDNFAKLLETDYGMTVSFKEEGFGLSVYQGEDPHLCRIIASRKA